MKKIDCENLSEAIQLVSASIEKKLQNDIERFGEASLILTGGSTVRPFLSELAKIKISWDKIWVVLSDERWVSIDDSMSNEKQLQMLFLEKLNVPCQYISLKLNYENPTDAMDDLQEKIANIQKPFSCSLLSIGDDGHVASLFPLEKLQWQQSKGEFFHSKFKGDRLSLNWSLLHRVKSSLLLLKKSRELDLGKEQYLKEICNENSSIIKF